MKILFLGDSITAGGRGEAVGYPVYAEKYIRAKFSGAEIQFCTEAAWGRRADELLQKIESGEISVQADVVLVLIGVNDVLKSFDDHSLTAETFGEIYENLLKKVAAEGASVIVIEPYLIFGEPMRSHKRPLLLEFNEKIYGAAKKYARAFIPTDGAFKSFGIEKNALDYTADGLHLNDRGARFLGKLVADAAGGIIETVLKKRSRT